MDASFPSPVGRVGPVQAIAVRTAAALWLFAAGCSTRLERVARVSVPGGPGTWVVQLETHPDAEARSAFFLTADGVVGRANWARGSIEWIASAETRGRTHHFSVRSGGRKLAVLSVWMDESRQLVRTTVRILSGDSGKELNAFAGSDSPASDEKLLFAGERDRVIMFGKGTLQALDSQSGQLIWSRPLPHLGAPEAVLELPGGRALVDSMFGFSVWDTGCGELLSQQRVLLTNATVHPSGCEVVGTWGTPHRSRRLERLVRQRLPHGPRVAQLLGRSGLRQRCIHLAFRRDGRILAVLVDSSKHDGRFYVDLYRWSAQSDVRYLGSVRTRQWCWSVQWTADGYLAVASGPWIEIWRLRDQAD